MLDDLKDLVKAFISDPSIITDHYTIRADGMYCPPCGDIRRMAITPIYLPFPRGARGPYFDKTIITELIPSVFHLRCLQCDTLFTAIIYMGAYGPNLAVLPSCRGGLTTPHTPSGIAYYLDQAQKAHSVGANSAAIAMFRGALEHLLFDQGYKTGMLGKKIDKICEDIKKGTAPKWALELDTDFLKILKDLGNASIHPNNGDVNKQATFDNKLIAQVKQLFLALLFIVYEVPQKKEDILKALRSKAQLFKK